MKPHWSELSFEFESSSIPDPRNPDLFDVLLVSFNVYGTGAYDEPILELDGDLLIELVHTPGIEPMILKRAAYVKQGDLIPEPEYEGRRYPDTHYGAVYGPNPAYRSTEIPFDSLTLEERHSINDRVERLMNETLDEHMDKISQDLAECAADAMHDEWKERGDW